MTLYSQIDATIEHLTAERANAVRRVVQIEEQLKQLTAKRLQTKELVRREMPPAAEVISADLQVGTVIHVSMAELFAAGAFLKGYWFGNEERDRPWCYVGRNSSGRHMLRPLSAIEQPPHTKPVPKEATVGAPAQDVQFIRCNAHLVLADVALKRALVKARAADYSLQERWLLEQASPGFIDAE